MNAESVKLFVLQEYSSFTKKKVFNLWLIVTLPMLIGMAVAGFAGELLSLLWLICLYIGYTIWGVYLLSNEERRNIKTNNLYEGTSGCFISVFCLLYILVMLSRANVSRLGYSTILLFLAVVVVLSIVVIIKMCNRKIAIINNENISNIGNNLMMASSAAGAVIGMGAARTFFSYMPPEITEVVGFVLIAILIIISVNAGSISYYNYYLIRKYCPEIQEEIKQNSHRNHRQM